MTSKYSQSLAGQPCIVQGQFRWCIYLNILPSLSSPESKAAGIRICWERLLSIQSMRNTRSCHQSGVAPASSVHSTFLGCSILLFTRTSIYRREKKKVTRGSFYEALLYPVMMFYVLVCFALFFITSLLLEERYGKMTTLCGQD